MCWNLQENMELLSKTNVYRQGLKQAANRFANELEKVIKRDMDLVFGVDDKALFKQLDYHKELIAEIASLKCEDNGVIAKMIQQYKEMPEEVLSALNIKLV